MPVAVFIQVGARHDAMLIAHEQDRRVPINRTAGQYAVLRVCLASQCERRDVDGVACMYSRSAPQVTRPCTGNGAHVRFRTPVKVWRPFLRGLAANGGRITAEMPDVDR